MRTHFLLAFVAIVALPLLLFSHKPTGGPVYLHPIMRYNPPHHSRCKNKQDPAFHNYGMWRPCLLLLYVACFFTTPTAPTTATQTHYYNTLT